MGAKVSADADTIITFSILYQCTYVEVLVFVILSAPQTITPTSPYEDHFSESTKMTWEGNDGICVCEQICADVDHIISYFLITFHPIDLRFTLLSRH